VQLEKLGWNGFFASQACVGVPGRVALANRECFDVWTAVGETAATPGGNLRMGPVWPAVGDWVVLRAEEAPVIESVLERRTVLSRKRPGRTTEEQALAANIDVLFIVSGLDGDYNERRIERYMVIARQSGARPVILLNKADLADERGIDLDEVVSRLQLWSGAVVLAISALAEQGLQRLDLLMQPGETAALIGSSGVGKSSILNRLLGEDRQRTRAVRSGDDRGGHATTERSLFLMAAGWMLIDMPGLREIQLWALPEQIDAGFEDVRELALGCRFRDCTHTGEPGCAVLDSDIDAGRLENYRKMQRELEYLQRKTNKQLMSENKARWKAIHKSARKSGKW
jgi:ribosome biogenesis GTPase